MARRVDPRVLRQRREPEAEPLVFPPEPVFEIPVFPEPNRLLRVSEGMVTWGDVLAIITVIAGVVAVVLGAVAAAEGNSGAAGGLIGGGITWIVGACLLRAWHHWAATVLEGFDRCLDQQQQQNQILARMEERLLH